MIPTRFADTHLHLWHEDQGFDYGWLDGPDDGDLGRVSEIRLRDWSPARFDEETRFTRPAFTVHVQATNAPTASVAETRWLVEARSALGTPTVIVARAELRDRGLTEELHRHRDAAGASFRGVRDMSTMGSLDDPALLGGLEILQREGLSWEASCSWQEMPALHAIAEALPDLTIVLGHTGWPVARDADYLSAWREGIRSLASAPNVVCKASGPGMTDHVWTRADWAPFVETVLEVFGADRSMFGSNWPVERIYASYETQLRVYAEILSGLSPDESDAFWYRTAHRTYSPSLENKGTNA